MGYADDRSSATNPTQFSGTEGNVCEGKDEYSSESENRGLFGSPSLRHEPPVKNT